MINDHTLEGGQILADKSSLFDSALLVASAETGGDLAALRENIEVNGLDERECVVGCAVVIRDRWANLVGAMKSKRPLPMFCHREVKRWGPVVIAFPGTNAGNEALAEWVVLAVETAVETRKALHRRSKQQIADLPQEHRARAQLAVQRWGKAMALES